MTAAITPRRNHFRFPTTVKAVMSCDAGRTQILQIQHIASWQPSVVAFLGRSIHRNPTGTNYEEKHGVYIGLFPLAHLLLPVRARSQCCYSLRLRRQSGAQALAGRRLGALQDLVQSRLAGSRGDSVEGELEQGAGEGSHVLVVDKWRD